MKSNVNGRRLLITTLTLIGCSVLIGIVVWKTKMPESALAMQSNTSSQRIKELYRSNVRRGLGSSVAHDQQNITYTVTPSGTKPDGRLVSFSPTNHTFPGLTSDVIDADDPVIFGQLSIDGTVKTENGSPLSQVKVTLLFEDPQTGDYQFFDEYDTNANGVFAFPNLTGGYAYLIVPQRTGYNFRFPDYSDLPVLHIPNLTAGLPGVRCLGAME